MEVKHCALAERLKLKDSSCTCTQVLLGLNKCAHLIPYRRGSSIPKNCPRPKLLSSSLHTRSSMSN